MQIFRFTGDLAARDFSKPVVANGKNGANSADGSVQLKNLKQIFTQHHNAKTNVRLLH
jgi:hypothetical protein